MSLDNMKTLNSMSWKTEDSEQYKTEDSEDSEQYVSEDSEIQLTLHRRGKGRPGFYHS